MGTTWHATIVETAVFTNGNAIPTTVAFEAIVETLARVDTRMSTYKASSEISRFAQAAANTLFPVSQETCTVVTEALRIAALSKGAYDPTIMPLVNLWGFGPAKRELTAPDSAALQEALNHVDFTAIQSLADETPASLMRTRDDVSLDLSSVAKGYGVDAAALALLASGFHDFYLEVGGEVRTHGNSPRGTAWRTGIDTPESAATPGAQLSGVVHSHNHAIATSGDYRNYRELNGRRVSHTLDARTGHPIAHTLASVTVLHPSCMTADALATAAMVLGPVAGLQLIEDEPQAEAFFVVRDSNRFITTQTSGFASKAKAD